MASDGIQQQPAAAYETEATNSSSDTTTPAAEEKEPKQRRINWVSMLGNRSKKSRSGQPSSRNSMSDLESQAQKRPDKWSMGILNDPETEEVPGSILLMSKVSEYNEPLGMRHAPARTSASSIPSVFLDRSARSSFSHGQGGHGHGVLGGHGAHGHGHGHGHGGGRRPSIPEKKRTADGKIVLEPQPDESPNDPLNWKMWRRDAALLSLGFYCMVGGGMTPILAAGFNEVADEFKVSVPQVALTTGLYMMGLGIGSVLLSPTAILFGKRPVYLVSAVVFILTSIWSALAPNFANLVVARIFMGIAVSSVECLPSATVAEIFFLHEKAYRLGIYTLLLLGGKNLVPLVSAVIVQALDWRWVFYIVAIIVGFGLALLFLFVPETFWDRTPRPHKHTKHRFPSKISLTRNGSLIPRSLSPVATRRPKSERANEKIDDDEGEPRRETRHAHFQVGGDDDEDEIVQEKGHEDVKDGDEQKHAEKDVVSQPKPKGARFQDENVKPEPADSTAQPPLQLDTQNVSEEGAKNANSDTADYFGAASVPATAHNPTTPPVLPLHHQPPTPGSETASLHSHHSHHSHHSYHNPYTEYYQAQPEKTFLQSLRPWPGRLCKDNWFRVAFRPFILFAYPSILWSTLVYSLSVGWLIVLSESVAHIYQDNTAYNFTSLQTGLVYISPFVGGVLGTAVAGKVSDVIVRYMSRRNGGIYEPEFRLVMALPVALFTTIGLMGYGWSAEERDNWIVPTVFFGFISFGCSLGSTTAITFAVDSYRQYAGEALVTLNFSKNVFHGLVFSLFFNHWLESEGSKDVFVAIGGIQMACLLTTVPMYVFGKKARMWTVRKNFMEKF